MCAGRSSCICTCCTLMLLGQCCWNNFHDWEELLVCGIEINGLLVCGLEINGAHAGKSETKESAKANESWDDNWYQTLSRNRMWRHSYGAFNLRAISGCPLLFTSVCSPLYPMSNLNSQSMLMQLTVGRILTISDINLKFSKYAGMLHGSSA